MGSIGDLMVRIGGDPAGFVEAMRSVSSITEETCDKVADRLEDLASSGQRMVVLGGMISAAFTLPLEEVARKSLDVAGSFEQTNIAFQTLMGSASEAKSMLSQLYSFAASTPFEIPQVLDGARKLMALGFASKDVIPMLRIVGDQAAAMGAGGAGMDRILMNLGKIQAEGKITGHTLRNLGEDNVPALESLALALGKSKAEVSEMVSKGQVDSETGINAILRGMQLRSGGLMESQMGTFKAQLSNMSDQITMTANAIGEALLPVGKTLVNWAQEAIGEVRELAQSFAQLPAPIQAAALAFGGLVALAGPALVAVGGLGMALPAIATGMGAIATFGSSIGGIISSVAGYTSTIAALASEEGIAATAGLLLSEGAVAVGAVFLSVPALITAAVVGLAALGTWVYTHWEGVKAALAQVFNGLGEAWNATLGVAVNEVSGMMGGSANDLIGIWNWFKGAFMEIWNAVGSFLHTTIEGFKSDIADLVKMLEKIPGMQKVFSAGDAFRKADHESSERSEMSDIGKKLRVGADTAPFTLHQKYLADLEKHNAKLKEAEELLAKYKTGLDDGVVSLKDYQQAAANVQFIKDEKIVDESKAGKSGKAKLDRNALDGLSGAHAHDEARFAFQRAQIEHDYQMSKPGSADTVGLSAEQLAAQDIAAAEKRKAALDASYADELKKSLANLNSKLALYKNDQAGHQKLIEAKLAAEDKYAAQIQKSEFDLETVKKQAADRIGVAQKKQIEDDLKAQEKAYEMALKTVDLSVKATEKDLQQKIKLHEFDAQMKDKQLQFELENGELSKQQYLRLKQEQYDIAYQMEMDAIQKERAEIEKEFADLRSRAYTDDQKKQVNADYRDRIQPLNDRQQFVQMKQAERKQDTDIALQRDQWQKMGTVFQPFQSNFASAITGMIEGTKTFQQAWNGMVTGMLGSWTNSLSQMASKWVTHLAQRLAMYVAHRLGLVAVHTTTNQATVASDSATSAQSFAISLGTHLKKIALKGVELAVHVATNIAKLASEIAYHIESWAIALAMHLKKVAMFAAQAAAGAFNAVVGIPIVGPALAPVAAAAAFVGVMAFGAVSAENGAVLPNRDIVGFLHPQEMVLPKPISVGLQNLIASGGLSNANGIMNQGASMGSTALQMVRNVSAVPGDVTHHHNWGGLTIHNTAKDPITEDKVFSLMQGAMRKRNLQMA